MIDEQFYERLNNWRRAYCDRFNRSVSITYVFCQYLKATTERAKETDEERKKREDEELANREPALPPINYKDADLLNEVWQAMPDYINYFPVKKAIKVLVFGTSREYEQFRISRRISNKDEPAWREDFIKKFKERVKYEEKN